MIHENGPSKRNVDKYFEENRPYTGLGRISLYGAVVFVAARGVNIFVQVASTIVLARLLSPHDFGLVAMVLALVGFAPVLIDLGTSDASAQKTRITEGEVSALFWLNVAIGIALTVLLGASSKLIALFFGEQELSGITLILSLTFIMTALSTQHYALMRRAMQFQHIAIIDILSNVVGSVTAIVMALAGWGYWALVAKPIVTSALAAVGVWATCPWLPGRPRVTPGIKELVGFGMGVTGFTMTDYFARSADRVAVGYFFGPGPLGFFQNAFLLYGNVLNILTEPLHNIATASLSKLRGDLDELKRSWAAALSLMSFISVATFAVLAVTGQDFVLLLLGEKWAPAGPLLSIFAVRGIAHCVERTLGWLHVAAGRSDRWTRWGLFSAVCQLVALVVGLPFGATGVAIAYTIVMFGLSIPAIVYAGRPLGIGAKDVLQAVGPQTAAGLVAVALGFVVQEVVFVDFSPLARVFLSAQICSVIYLVVVVGIFKVTGPLRLAFSLLSGFSPIRAPGELLTRRVSKFMKFAERILVALDGWPWSIVSRAALGFIALPVFRVLTGDSSSILTTLALFIVLLAALRVVPMALRHSLPFSPEATTIWRERRQIAKQYDSYQWQKLFWIGLGLLPHAVIDGGLRNGELVVTFICLIGGGAGLIFWHSINSARSAN